MDLWSAIFTVIRRWYVALPILLVSIVAMVVIGGKMKPDYKAEASVVFTAPARKVVNGQEQPFKNQYANDTKTLAAAVYRQITNADQHRTLEEDGFSPRYELVLDQFSAIMDIEVTATSQEQAIDTANQLISETDRNALAIQRQSRPPEDELVRVDKIYLPVDAELVPGSKSRVMATVLLLGLVAAASAAFMVESLATRRRGLATDAGGAVRYPDGVVRQPDAGPAAAPADGLAGAGASTPYAGGAERPLRGGVGRLLDHARRTTSQHAPGPDRGRADGRGRHPGRRRRVGCAAGRGPDGAAGQGRQRHDVEPAPDHQPRPHRPRRRVRHERSVHEVGPGPHSGAVVDRRRGARQAAG